MAIAYEYLYGAGTPLPVDERPLSGNDELGHVSHRPIDPSQPQVVFGLGNCLEANNGAYKIGYTMLETDRIPKEWARQANLMDEVMGSLPIQRREFSRKRRDAPDLRHAAGGRSKLFPSRDTRLARVGRSSRS